MGGAHRIGDGGVGNAAGRQAEVVAGYGIRHLG